MPEFVKKGTQTKEQEEEQIVKHDDIVRSGIVQDQDEERKTLYEQFQESKARKQDEYTNMVAARNSSYKLDEKSAEFYNKLRDKEEMKNRNNKEFERIEMEKYKIKKSKIEKTQKHDTKIVERLTKVQDTDSIPGSIRIRRKTKTSALPTVGQSLPTATEHTADKPIGDAKTEIPGLGDYSSSDEE